MKVKIPKVNMALLLIKGHYFLQHAGLGPISPFVPVIAKDLGFSSISVGWIYTVSPIFSFFMKPIVGSIADKFKIQKAIFILLLILICISMFLIQWVPPISLFNSHQFKCNEVIEDICSVNKDVDLKVNFTASKGNKNLTHTQNEALEKYCDFETPFNEHPLLKCNSLLDDQALTEHAILLKYQFWLLLGLVLTLRVSVSCSYSIADAICLTILDKNPESFGLQRLWAPLGYGLAPLVSNLLISYVPGGQNHPYQLAFYISLAFLLLDIILASQLKVAPNQGKKYILSDVTTVLKDLKICLFLMWCFLVGFYHSSISSFIFWFVEDLDVKLGGRRSEWIKILEGTIVLFQTCVGEVPLLFLSGWILKKAGHTICMTIVLSAFALRLFFYSTLTNPWLILPVEILHGLTAGLFYVTMATYAKLISPPGTECTIQSLVSVMFEGAGTSVGALLTGYLIKLFGYSMTYFIMAASAFIFFILHLCLANYQMILRVITKVPFTEGDKSFDKMNI